MLRSFLDQFVAHADAEKKEEEKEEDKPEEEDKDKDGEEGKDDGEESKDDGEEGGEEEEEDEPEDEHPKIREECQQSAKCAPAVKHFEHCQEKVREGKGFKGEDCVEELFHVMHCADECAAPKLWAKLK